MMDTSLQKILLYSGHLKSKMIDASSNPLEPLYSEHLSIVQVFYPVF